MFLFAVHVINSIKKVIQRIREETIVKGRGKVEAAKGKIREINC